MTTPRDADLMAADIHAHAVMAARAHTLVAGGETPSAGPIPRPADGHPTTDRAGGLAARAGDDDLSPSSPVAGRCPVTVYVDRSPGVMGMRGGGSGRESRAPNVHTSARPCGEPVDRGGLCEDHADDRDRLAT